MTKKQIYLFSAVCLHLAVFVAMPAAAVEKTYTLGGKTGWSPVVSRENVVSGSGVYGYEAMTLEDYTPPVSADTDLLLTFENGCRDESGNYIVTSSGVQLTDDAKRGNSAALFWENGIRLSGRDGSVFGSEGLVGSFTISFWLKPLLASNGEIIFSWYSSRNLDEYSLYQMIMAMIHNNHIEWEFTNIFNQYNADNGEVLVSGRTMLVPETWSYHQLSYDEISGMLEYRVNNRVEDVQYVTANKTERGLLYPAMLGVPAAIDIGSFYTGYLDNFTITRAFTDVQPSLDTYEVSGGSFESDRIQLSSSGAVLSHIDVLDTVPEQTDIEYYVRSADSPWNWTSSYPEWKHFTPGESLSDVNGMYFQVAAQLYPDGAGSVSPSVTQINIVYEENEPPFPPYSVFADAGDGYVDITWSASPVNSRTASGGYLVYYGERPGEYLGYGAVQGNSPVCANGNTLRISGLKNGKIYYFAVAACTAGENQLIGPLSKEVYARPIRK